MPAAAAAACARSSDRLAMASTSACVDRAKAGTTRLLLFATPRMPQRNPAVVDGMTNLHFQRVVRGPDQRRPRVQSNADFHSLHEPGEPPFVREAAQEAPVLEYGQDLGSDPASNEHPRWETLQGEV